MKKVFGKVMSLLLAVIVMCTSTVNACALSPEDEEIIRGVYDFVDKTLEKNSIRGGKLKECENLAEKAKISANGVNKTASLTDDRRLTGALLTEQGNIFVNFKTPVTANTIVLRELVFKIGSSTFPFEGGTDRFSIYASMNGEEKLIYRNDRIDVYRLCSFPETTFDSLRIQIDSCRRSARINEVEIYNVGKVKQNFRVNDYFVYDSKDYAHNEKFINYLDTVTDLTMFIGLWIDKDGNIVCGDGMDKFEERLADVRTAIGDKDIKLYVNIYSADTDGEYFMRTSKNIAKSSAEFLTKYNLDGVDLDWEYPDTPEDWKAYNQLTLDLHSALSPIGKKFSYATSMWNLKFTKEAMKAVDYLNVMLYDMTDSDKRGYHSTFKDHSHAIELLYHQGVDLSKVCLGIPYYGRDTAENPDLCWVDYDDSGITDKWTNYVPDCNYTERNTGKPGVGGVYFNGYAMTRDKTAYAIDAGIGGVMSWSMMSDFPVESELSLHRAVNDACEQRLASSCSR